MDGLLLLEDLFCMGGLVLLLPLENLYDGITLFFLFCGMHLTFDETERSSRLPALQCNDGNIAIV